MSEMQQPVQLTGEQMDEILQAALAPWDARSWANLEERYPRTAEALAHAVRFGGLTVERLGDYCTRWGYLPEVFTWLRQCVLHLRRMQADEGDETAALTSPPSSDACDDGCCVGDAVSGALEVTPDGLLALRSSLRLVEPDGRSGARRLLEQGEDE